MSSLKELIGLDKLPSMDTIDRIQRFSSGAYIPELRIWVWETAGLKDEAATAHPTAAMKMMKTHSHGKDIRETSAETLAVKGLPTWEVAQ